MRDTASPGELPLVTRARVHGGRPAVADPDGTFTYAQLLAASEVVAKTLLREAGGGTEGGDPSDDPRPDLSEARVAYLLPPGFPWVAVQWGIWRAGGVAVPLAVSHPPPELAHVLDDAEPSLVVTGFNLEGRLAPLLLERRIPLLRWPELVEGGQRTGGPGRGSTASEADGTEGLPLRPLPPVATGRRAMILYTSGTTGRSKGVVTTHANLEAQITSLVEAWGWSPDDRILHVLPLHHVHGIVNVLSTALWTGARCRFPGRSDSEGTWEAIRDGDDTLFMAVPTIYARLLARAEEAPAEERDAFSRACGKMRLMISGSAALPVSVLEAWRSLTGHTLLERYGMTEVGMALSNPLEGVRRPGHVGRPLPGVSVRLVAEDGTEAPPGDAGEIRLRGAGIFLEYWRRPRETDESFRDGWFLTGDVAVEEGGSYRILGRRSVDIIKTGGYKVSALEVEEVIREHPAIRECAVVGVPDPEWGERVAAAVVLRKGAADPSEGLREWAKERLAPYKAPTLVLALPDLPRNAMGKVTKSELRRLLEARAPA